MASPGSELFDGLFVPDDVRDAVSDRAWVAAMLEFEAALARAEAAVGLISGEAADAIAAVAGDAERFDAAALGRDGRASGNPAAPLVRVLTEAVGGHAAGFVHLGATSQDVMDTAAMLVSRRAAAAIDRELASAAGACAALAEDHRGTLMPARTLLQQALPTTFGLKAAGWLVALLDARRRLAEVSFSVQLGGAAGTLASLGADGPRVLDALADELELERPALPWHADRGRVADLAAALALVAGTVEKVALDIALLAQTEVGEVAEAGGGGGSSTLPHKRNPVGAAMAIASARRGRGEASVLIGGMAGEHERAVGAWQAEWPALTDALAYAGGAAAALAGTLGGLEVHPEAMRRNLELTGGLILAEAVSTALVASGLGRLEAHELMQEASRRAAEAGRPLRDELRNDAGVSARLSADELDRALDPAAYLGSAEEFVERALALHREGAA
ncbi:MAG TPA: 3-carboxy-cis,cis-muconate cycloisomerase [Thermoleophilaceae bacterium]|nr:3-carboxy-cis,cis-muconate cycloisomerase [Thermoleophilaceae bacterium]